MEIDEFISRLLEDPEFLQVTMSNLPASEIGGFLDTLGLALREKYENTSHSLDDLNRAVEMEELGFDLTPNDHPERATRLNHLSVALQRRFERIGSMDDANRAIKTYQQALELTRVDNIDYCTYLTNLGSILLSRFDQIGSMEDLDWAIAINEQAIELLPENHPDCVSPLNNLGLALFKRFQRNGLREDIDRAITFYEQAVASSAQSNHPNYALFLSNLGAALSYMRRWITE